MERADVSGKVKRRIDLAGEMFETSTTSSDAEAAQRNRLMQAQILIEVTGLHCERRPDETAFTAR